MAIPPIAIVSCLWFLNDVVWSLLKLSQAPAREKSLQCYANYVFPVSHKTI